MCYRTTTGAVERKKAKPDLSQQSVLTLNSVSVFCTLSPKQYSAHIRFIAFNYISHSYFYQHSHEISDSDVRRRVSSVSKKLAFNFSTKN